MTSNHIKNVHLETATDIEIWNYAKKNGFHLVSKDTDFIEMSLLLGFPPKIILIKTGNSSTEYLMKQFESKLDEVNDFINDDTVSVFEIQ